MLIDFSVVAHLSMQDQRQRVGVFKRKAKKTAGQVLMMLSLGVLTNLCGTGAEGAQAAVKLYHVRYRSPFFFVLFFVFLLPESCWFFLLSPFSFSENFFPV